MQATDTARNLCSVWDTCDILSSSEHAHARTQPKSVLEIEQLLVLFLAEHLWRIKIWSGTVNIK
jgi:hypothetical protein